MLTTLVSCNKEMLKTPKNWQNSPPPFLRLTWRKLVMCFQHIMLNFLVRNSWVFSSLLRITVLTKLVVTWSTSLLHLSWSVRVGTMQINNCKLLSRKNKLTYFWQMSLFYTPWKHKKPNFSGVFRGSKMGTLVRGRLRWFYVALITEKIYPH